MLFCQDVLRCYWTNAKLQGSTITHVKHSVSVLKEEATNVPGVSVPVGGHDAKIAFTSIAHLAAIYQEMVRCYVNSVF